MLTRRGVLSFVPAVAALLAEGVGEAQQAAAPARVGRDQIKTALTVLGLDFPDAQLDMMIPNVNQALARMETLRGIDVPLDTPPAFYFRAPLPGMEPKARRSKFAPTKVKKLPAFKSVEDLAFWPVTRLAPLVKARKIRSRELTEMYLARIKKYSPQLLNVVTITERTALEQADAADKEIRSGHYKGPLHGIPYGAKDLFAFKEYKTTWGAEPYRDQTIPYNATIIDKLDKAGAVLVAKTSMGALAQGDRWFGGVTKNPWNIEEGSSGSSAGSASGTVAGLFGFSIGTETLGSIISPSTRCGASGLRPTFGRVSRYGGMALSWTMDKVGPICRSAEDCALVLRAIQGPDNKDVTVFDAPLDWDPARPLKSMRIGMIDADFARVNGPAKDLQMAAIEALKSAGANLQSVELPAMESDALRGILTAEAAAAFDDITRDRRVETLSGQAPGDWPNSFRSARLLSAVEYIRASRARTILQQKMHEFMSQWDCILTPNNASLLVITNFTGHPQACVPVGYVNGKSPVSITFAGKLFEEGAPLRVAHAYQQVTKWHEMNPPMDWVV